MNALFSAAGFLLCAATLALSQDLAKSGIADVAKYDLTPGPPTAQLLLQKGDRLAICGDSITEQKMYSRMMETYLTVCVPELKVSCRQYGWSGERAEGFHHRMKNDVLRFQPSIATTCYGMNDHQYVPYTEAIGAYYVKHQTDVVKTFTAAGVRVVLGSPGTIGKVPHWVKTASGTWEDLNLSLNKFRNHDIAIAQQEHVAFADVFQNMLLAGVEAQKRHGAEFLLCGNDGVHPEWSGQAVMAYSFLTALGLEGNLGGVEVDLTSGSAVARDGHEVISFAAGELKLRSSRYPFCCPKEDVTKQTNMAAGLALVPFHEKLNRFSLTVKGAPEKGCAISWGGEKRDFTRAQLEKGINLAAEFADNPFLPAFKKISEAVYNKQAFETKQIKELFHGEAGKKDMEGTVLATEKERDVLVTAMVAAFLPVEHALTLTPIQ